MCATPVALRNLFGWRTGGAIDFVLYEDQSRVELVAKRNAVTSLKGMIAKPQKPITLAEMESAIGMGG